MLSLEQLETRGLNWHDSIISNRQVVGTAQVVISKLLARGGNGDAYLARLQSYSLDDAAAALPWYESAGQPEWVVVKLAWWPTAELLAERESKWFLSKRTLVAWQEYSFLRELEHCSHVIKPYGFGRLQQIQQDSASMLRSNSTAATSAADTSSSMPPQAGSNDSSSAANTLSSIRMPAILMQWAQHGSLRSHLNPSPGVWQPMSPRQAWYVVKDTHTVLAAMSSANIVFRDLNPQNVLVIKPPHAIRPWYAVCDFESAYRLTGSSMPENDGSFGTDGYNVPDRFWTWVSDTWQLGLLLLSCRAGTVKPPNGRSLADIISSAIWAQLLPVEPMQQQQQQRGGYYCNLRACGCMNASACVRCLPCNLLLWFHTVCCVLPVNVLQDVSGRQQAHARPEPDQPAEQAGMQAAAANAAPAAPSLQQSQEKQQDPPAAALLAVR